MNLKALDIVNDGKMSSIIRWKELDTNPVQYSRIQKNYNEDNHILRPPFQQMEILYL
jgi:hypothetical protein